MSHYLVGVISETGREEEVAELLAPFDEELDIEPYVNRTREQLVEDGKTTQKNWIEYLETEADKEELIYMLTKSDYSWLRNILSAKTDEDYYMAELNSCSMVDEEGNELSTYNPDSKWDWWSIGGRWSGEISNAENDTIQLKDIDFSKDISTYAILTSSGQWLEPGCMGWFGCSSASEEEERKWYNDYKKLLQSFDPELYLTIVDCHI